MHCWNGPNTLIKGSVQRSLEEARRENLLRRSREEIVQKLQGLLPTLPEQSQQQIRQCLSPGRNAALEEVEALWQELQSQSHESTPEARLNLLLDSSKEYCNEEEFPALRSSQFSNRVKGQGQGSSSVAIPHRREMICSQRR